MYRFIVEMDEWVLTERKYQTGCCFELSKLFNTLIQECSTITSVIKSEYLGLNTCSTLHVVWFKLTVICNEILNFELLSGQL